ncbi:cytochrome c-type biogenesis protein [Lysobacter koreensis]|uniref:Cytochrome c-type biogenesis protein n=1 Tax=Lysobacter koreensis TaxID=266122 RepID=A0ABW2YNH0_9GAMM
MKLWLLSALLFALLASPPAFAQAGSDATPPQFTSAAEERRFHALVAELRCVMCQNQSLADSNAQIARDLRREVLELMRQGKSDREVKQFLVARYGEFVLYRPQVESKTWLLWFGPALLLLAGGAVVAGVVRKRAGKPVPPARDDARHGSGIDDGGEW